MAWNPGRDFLFGLQAGQGFAHNREDRAHLRDQRSREAQTLALEQLRALRTHLATDPETGALDLTRLTTPEARGARDRLIAGNPALQALYDAEASDGAPGPRSYRGTAPMPDGNGVTHLMQAPDRDAPGPLTKHRLTDDDDAVVRLDGQGLWDHDEYMLATHLPGYADSQRARIQGRHHRGQQADLAGHFFPTAPDYSGEIETLEGRLAELQSPPPAPEEPAAAPPQQQAPQPALEQAISAQPGRLSEREIALNAQAIPDPRDRAAYLQSQGVELPSNVVDTYGLGDSAPAPEEPAAAPPPQQAPQPALDQAISAPAMSEGERERRQRLGLLRRDLAALEGGSRGGARSQRTQTRMARLESAIAQEERFLAGMRRNNPTPAQPIPAGEAPASPPLREEPAPQQSQQPGPGQTQAGVRQINATIARLREAERAGKATTGVREAVAKAVRSGAIDLGTAKEIAEMSRRPKIKMQVEADGQIHVLDEYGGTARVFNVGEDPEAAAKARRDTAEEARKAAKYTTDFIGTALERSGFEKNTHEYRYLNMSYNIIEDEGLIDVLNDPTGAAATLAWATDAVNAQRSRGWFGIGRRRMQDVDMAASVRTGPHRGPDESVKDFVEDIMPRATALTRVEAMGVSRTELFNAMTAMLGAMDKSMDPRAARAAIRAALEENPEQFVQEYVRR